MSLRNLLPIGRAFGSPAERSRFRSSPPAPLPPGRPAAGLVVSGGSVGVVAGSVGVGGDGGAEGRAAASGSGSGSGGRDRSQQTFKAGMGIETSVGPLGSAVVGASVVGRGNGRPAMDASGRRLPGWLEQFLLAVFRPGNRRRSTRTVQTEMCFQSVKVARNDLAVSDMEVVVRSPERRTMSPDCRARVLRLWWDQGTRRLRRWGQNLF